MKIKDKLTEKDLLKFKEMCSNWGVGDESDIANGFHERWLDQETEESQEIAELREKAWKYDELNR